MHAVSKYVFEQPFEWMALKVVIMCTIHILFSVLLIKMVNILRIRNIYFKLLSAKKIF